MNKMPGDFNSTSPLLSFFDKSTSETKTFQSCEIRGLKKPISINFEASCLFDLSCLRKLVIIGKEAALITKTYFGLDSLKPFQWVSVGSGGIICLNQEKIILINSYDETLIDGFKNSVPPNSVNYVVQRADYCEFAITGPVASKVLKELVPVPDSAWSESGLLCGSLAGSNAILRKVNKRSDHLRCILQPADAHYVFSTIVEINNETDGKIGCIFSYNSSFER